MTTDGGRALRFVRYNQGRQTAPWLLMVHGVSQDHRLFDRQVTAFRDRYNLLLIDLPGHGLSTDLPGPYAPDAFADGIAATLDQLSIKRCHGWGTHLGATALLLSASTRPSAFESLILEAPVVPGVPLPSVSELLPRVRQLAADVGIAAARDYWWREGGWFTAMKADPVASRAAAQRRMIDSFGGAPWTSHVLLSSGSQVGLDTLASVTVPTLIINGTEDLPDFKLAADCLAATLPNSQKVMIAEAGGFPLWERPNETNAKVGRFLKDLNTQRQP